MKKTSTIAEDTGTKTGTIEERNINSVLDTLSSIEKQIVMIMYDNPSITLSQLTLIIGLSKNGIRYNVDKLKNKGIITRVGSNRKGQWIVNK